MSLSNFEYQKIMQIFEFHSATAKVEPGQFTDRQWSLENRKLYNHGLSTTEHIVNLDD